jgi:ATP-binding cassette subfamily B protein
MDCGPAALACLIQGFGLRASYGRLREACQTDVDGTSIDTLEDIAKDVGLVAEQILLPIDHVLPSAREVLPAIAVVRQAGGVLHFVVAWRAHGSFVQVMDPATGRRWPRAGTFLDELYEHRMPVPAEAWRSWAGSTLFHDGLRARARGCGIADARLDALIADASGDPGWRGFATLDATIRMIGALRRTGHLGRADGERTFETMWTRARAAKDPATVVPADYWTVTPAPDVDGEPRVTVRGAVLVTVKGVQPLEARQRREAELSPEVVAALNEEPIRPAKHLLSLLAADGALAPAVLAGTLLLAAAGVVVEALLFRSLLDLGAHLTLTGQRIAAMAAVLFLSAILLLLEVPMATMALGFGRRLETRLRAAFLRKIPRLTDRYLQSRPSSDMAERAHAAHQIRELPNLGAQFARGVFEIVLTTIGIVLLYPDLAPIAVAGGAATLAIPFVVQPWLRERDLRQRTHTGALTRFYLDAFLGLIPVRAHGAERALAREQEALLVEWARAGRALVATVVTASGLQLVAGFGFAAWLLFARVGFGQAIDEGGGVLLLAYWALNIPLIGQEIAQIAWQYPTERNLALRLIEPLGAIEEPVAEDRSPVTVTAAAARRGVSVELRDVVVRAAGHTILEDASATLEPGSHVAIVGPSGAGKSTLVGLLLGWSRPASGEVLIDGAPLDATRLDTLRQETAWIDPAVYLWNRSLVENLEFGNRGDGIADRVARAELRSVIEQLPDGLQTMLGEGGTLVSGGEGQRVRFGRGLGRPDARLVVMDEPFRGLERGRRSAMLRRAREQWAAATLICVTHDIGETAGFDRVLVIADGRIAEDGTPAGLASQPGSRYRTLLDAEERLRQRLWADRAWRTVRIENGRIVPMPDAELRAGSSATRHAPHPNERGSE